MKISRNLYVLLILSMILLAGCEKPLVKEGADNIPAGAEMESVKQFDCGMLQNDKRKTECKNMQNEIAADAVYSEIRTTFDLKRCDELDTNGIEDCKNFIQKTGVQGPIAEDEVTALKVAMQMSYKAPEVTDDAVNNEDIPVVQQSEGFYDLAKCADLTTPGLKEYCEGQLNKKTEEEKMYKMIDSGDIAGCDGLTDESLKQSCKDELGSASKKPNAKNDTVEQFAPRNLGQ
jgi:hypothetical protein